MDELVQGKINNILKKMVVRSAWKEENGEEWLSVWGEFDFGTECSRIYAEHTTGEEERIMVGTLKKSYFSDFINHDLIHDYADDEMVILPYLIKQKLLGAILDVLFDEESRVMREKRFDAESQKRRLISRRKILKALRYFEWVN